MSKVKINNIGFKAFDREAQDFYAEHGWVVLKDVLTQDELNTMDEGLQRITLKQADKIGCELKQYLNVICQWWDLWKHDAVFAKLQQQPLSKIAAIGFDLPGCQLLHDHLITKQFEGCNGEVPWHQDSMYWPVDLTGASTWVPLQDTPVELGCLEVVDGSHLWGISKPVDFMRDGNCLPQDEHAVVLPVEKGDVVLLHSLTWHRSSPSIMPNLARKAYIASWIPQGSNYYPANAPWHPINWQVTVESGQNLNIDEFPVYGELSDLPGNAVKNCHGGPKSNEGMFNAKNRVAGQIGAILGVEGDLGELLSVAQNRDKVIESVISSKPSVVKEQIESLVESLWISAAAYEQTRARNVFGSAYKQWEDFYATV